MKFKASQRWPFRLTVLGVVVAVSLGFWWSAGLGMGLLFPGILLLGMVGHYTDNFQHEVRIHKFLVCFKCHEDLAGVPEGACPRCGTAFTPRELRERWERHSIDTGYESDRS